jgi:SPP1 family predicted phage head-tail adaptor
MKIGKLRHRIAIEQVANIQDSDGSVIETWSGFAMAQASMEPVSGWKHFAGQTTHANITHRVCMRYIPAVIPRMRIVCQSRIFEILSAVNSRERNTELQLMCRESIG